MIVRREALVSALAGTTADDTRYALNGVQIKRNGDVVSTDGHIAFVIHDTAPMDPSEFPIVLGADFHGEPTVDVVVPADTCKRLINAMPKGKRSLPILNGVKVGRNGVDGITVLTATDLSVPAVATIAHDTYQSFPAIDKVIPPADRSLVRVVLGVPVLEAMIKAAKAVQSSKRTPTVTLQMPAPDKNDNSILSAMRLEITGDNGLEITGAVMPCRL